MKTKIIRIVIFFLIILIIPAFTLLGEKDTVSYNENKTLAQFPQLSVESWKNRSFMNGMADFFSDHFVLREEFIKLKNKIETIIGKNEINNVVEYNGTLIQTFKDTDYSLTDKNLSSLNKLKEKYTDIPFYFMPIITAQEVYSDSLPEYLNLDSEKDYIDYCFNKLININKIDVSDAIKSVDYPFYRTDHHWTSACAYNSYINAAPILGFEPKKDMVSETVTSEFKGTLYSKTLNENISADSISVYKSTTDFSFSFKNNTVNSLYFEEFLNEKDKYSYFLSGNHGISYINNNDLPDGDKLLVIKDSYANCMLPFLAEHYSQITVVDPRYCNYNQIKEVIPSDYCGVLVLFNVSGFSQEQNFSLIEFMGE